MILRHAFIAATVCGIVNADEIADVFVDVIADYTPTGESHPITERGGLSRWPLSGPWSDGCLPCARTLQDALAEQNIHSRIVVALTSNGQQHAVVLADGQILDCNQPAPYPASERFLHGLRVVCWVEGDTVGRSCVLGGS